MEKIMNPTNVLIRFSALFLVSAISTTPARAADTSAEHVSGKIVSYADLDLTSLQGASLLYKRLTRAANDVCPNPYMESQPFLAQKAWECRPQTVEWAVRSINSPLLTAVFKRRTGHEPSAIRLSQAR